MFVPVKVRPNRTERGWKPVAGWYLWDCRRMTIAWHKTTQIRGGFDKPFPTKRECQKACDEVNKG
jgi:hypothetical protein